MKRFGAFLVVSLLILTRASADNKKETERVENAGKVMKEILNVPDNILEGSTLRPDESANKNLYGKEISAEDIVLRGAVPAPACANRRMSLERSRYTNTGTGLHAE